jgi:hypothetical protein
VEVANENRKNRTRAMGIACSMAREISIESAGTVSRDPQRLIGTIRREYLDHIFFRSTADLEKKFTEFGNYYNRHRVHSSLDGQTPAEITGERANAQAALRHFHWQTHCRGLYELPVAA